MIPSSIPEDLEGVGQGAPWQTLLARPLAVQVPSPTVLRTLSEASTFLTVFPESIDGGVGAARILVSVAVLSCRDADIEKATDAVAAVIHDRHMA